MHTHEAESTHKHTHSRTHTELLAVCFSLDLCSPVTFPHWLVCLNYPCLLVNPLTYTQGGGKASETERIGERERESWIMARPALGVLCITQLYEATNTGLAGRQANTQVVHVTGNREQLTGQQRTSTAGPVGGLNWPSPLTIVLLDLEHTTLQHGFYLCVCVCVWVLYLVSTSLKTPMCVPVMFVCWTTACVFVCVEGGCLALCQASAVLSKWGVLILRVLRFHASAHSRRDLPEVTDCQPPSTPTFYFYSSLLWLNPSCSHTKYFTFSQASALLWLFPPSLSPTLLSVLPSRCLSSHLLFIPREFHHAQSFSIFHVFYLSTEERTCEPLPNKGKTPSCHLRKCCRVEGAQGGRSTGGQREVDSTESRIKREMLGRGNRNTMQKEWTRAIPEQFSCAI